MHRSYRIPCLGNVLHYEGGVLTADSPARPVSWDDALLQVSGRTPPREIDHKPFRIIDGVRISGHPSHRYVHKARKGISIAQQPTLDRSNGHPQYETWRPNGACRSMNEDTQPESRSRSTRTSQLCRSAAAVNFGSSRNRLPFPRKSRTLGPITPPTARTSLLATATSICPSAAMLNSRDIENGQLLDPALTGARDYNFSDRESRFDLVSHRRIRVDCPDLRAVSCRIQNVHFIKANAGVGQQCG